jgi:hypothetical protein
LAVQNNVVQTNFRRKSFLGRFFTFKLDQIVAGLFDNRMNFAVNSKSLGDNRGISIDGNILDKKRSVIENRARGSRRRRGRRGRGRGRRRSGGVAVGGNIVIRIRRSLLLLRLRVVLLRRSGGLLRLFRLVSNN